MTVASSQALSSALTWVALTRLSATSNPTSFIDRVIISLHDHRVCERWRHCCTDHYQPQRSGQPRTEGLAAFVTPVSTPVVTLERLILLQF